MFFNLRDGTESSGGGINVGSSSDFAVGDIQATDFDSDYQADDLYFGTYNTSSGNFYRLRIRNSATAGDYITSPSSWVVSSVVNTGRPIFAPPEMAVDANKNTWLYFGTGLFLALEHVSETTEYIYGIKETRNCWNGTDTGATCEYNNLFLTRDTMTSKDVKFVNADATELICYCAGSPLSVQTCTSPGVCPGSCGTDEDRIVTAAVNAELTGSGTSCDNELDSVALNCLTDEIVSNYEGWQREALTYDINTSSEVSSKVFAKPFVGQGLVNLTAYHPTTTACSFGGDTYLLSIHYTTGTSYFQPTMFLEGGTTGSTGSMTIRESAYIGKGVPPLGESIIALPLPGDSYKVITQVSGALPGTTLSPSAPFRKGFITWLTK